MIFLLNSPTALTLDCRACQYSSILSNLNFVLQLGQVSCIVEIQGNSTHSSGLSCFLSMLKLFIAIGAASDIMWVGLKGKRTTERQAIND